MPTLLRAETLFGHAAAAARTLHRVGVGAGTRVALLGGPSAAYVAALAGLWRLGAVAVPLSPREPAPALLERLRVSGATHLLTAAGGALPALPGVAVHPLEPLEQAAASGARLTGPPDEAAAALVFTSGSTGPPKAAVLTHGALRWSALGVAEALGFGADSAWALALPLHHVGGLGVVVRALSVGGALVVPAPGEALADTLAHPALTHASLVATQLRRLLADAPAVLDGRTLLLGGSALPPALLDAAYARGLAVAASYGLTEMASTVTATPLGGTRADLATSGRVLPFREVEIAGGPGGEDQTPGEIRVRGRTRFSGYATEAGLVEPFDAEGFYATGDLGHFDAAGRLVVAGRRDLMFVSGGENVHPERIERALGGLAGVEEAVVVPVDDPAFGQRPFAFVRMAPGHALQAARLRDGLREQLPGFLVPVGVAPLPDTGGLKPARARLQADAAVRWRPV